MAIPRGIAYCCIVSGFVIVALSFGCIVAGAVAISKLNEPVSSIGLWAIYVSLKLFCTVCGIITPGKLKNKYADRVA